MRNYLKIFISWIKHFSLRKIDPRVIKTEERVTYKPLGLKTKWGS